MPTVPSTNHFDGGRVLFWSLALGVICGVLVVVAWSLPLTSALFADTDAATGNTFTGGTLDLTLSEVGPATEDSTTDEANQDTVSDTWEDLHHDSLVDEDPINNTLRLDNSASTLSATRVNITVLWAENDSGGSADNPDETARTIVVTQFIYDDTDLVGSEITDENGNSQIDLEDLSLGGTSDNLSSLSAIAADGTVDLALSFLGDRDLISGVGSGDGLDVTIDVRVHNSSFVDRDVSENNTIRYD